jgi:hypothetical protein
VLWHAHLSEVTIGFFFTKFAAKIQSHPSRISATCRPYQTTQSTRRNRRAANMHGPCLPRIWKARSVGNCGATAACIPQLQLPAIELLLGELVRRQKNAWQHALGSQP